MWRARATRLRACVAEEAARPAFSQARHGEGSGVFAPNPSFLVSETRFLCANRKSTSLENALEHQPACKPGFVGRRPLAQTTRDGHSSGTMFAHCLEQPTRTASLTSPCGVFAHRANEPALPSLFGLAPGVVCHAVSVAGPAVRSYRTFSPLPPSGEEAVRSLWHCPWGCPRRMLSGTVCRWSPDFPLQPPFDDCRSGRPAD